MTRWMVLPYDDSPLARATLRRAAALLRRHRERDAGLLLATVGVEPEAHAKMLREAAPLAGPDAKLRVQVLHAGEPLASLRRLIEELPDAPVAAPSTLEGAAPWCAAAWRLDGLDARRVLFFLTSRDLRAAAPARTQSGVEAQVPARTLRPRLQLRWFV